MKFKPVPDPPTDLERVATIHRTVPADPNSVDDCCHELVAQTPISTRDDAATWLTFLRALEAAEETPDGFRRRTHEDGLDPDQLRRAFRERVYGSSVVLEVIAEADRPHSSDEVVRCVAERTRHKTGARGRDGGTAADARRGRVERLLEWAVLLDLVDRNGDRYRSR